MSGLIGQLLVKLKSPVLVIRVIFTAPAPELRTMTTFGVVVEMPSVCDPKSSVAGVKLNAATGSGKPTPLSETKAGVGALVASCVIETDPA